MKRILDCRASDFKKMNGQDLKAAIRAAEGRTLIAEVIGSLFPLYPSVTNVELAAAFGADIILLNMFDVFDPFIFGLEIEDSSKVVYHMKEMVGRPIGLNLEPVDPSANRLEELIAIPEGRTATEKTLTRAKELGFDFLCLTGNPKTGVSNAEIAKAIAMARKVFGEEGLIFAGKMHGAGVAGESGDEIVNVQELLGFIQAGADVILLPAPGTLPGITLDSTRQLVKFIHQQGALAMLTIGTSQEGADEGTIRQIALMSKMAGADLYHIGDAGYTGIAVPENIMTYSIAIRGRRHTYVRMASSALR